MSEQNVAVIGVGRIGAVTAVGLSHLLHNVTGIDRNQERVAALSRGELVEAEPALRAALRSALRLRSIRFVTEAEPRSFGAVFLCVDTPPGPGGEPDLSQIFAAGATAARLAAPGAIIVTRSTTPPGTGDRLQAALRSAGRQDIQVVHVPEFLREGRAWEDFHQPDRIVIGSDSRSAGRRVRELFTGLDCPVFETSRRTAELAKYAANAFLATTISFANEISDLGTALGADTAALFDILRTDHRIGRQAYLTPGLGFGGHCLPKDTAALDYVAAIHGQQMYQLRATSQVNRSRVSAAVAWLRSTLAGIEGKTIAIAGLAFKPGTDDLRDSPALAVARTLRAEGARVVGFDPHVKHAPPYVELAASLGYALDGADALLVAYRAAWVEDLAPSEASSRMSRRVVFDAPGVFDAPEWAAAGFAMNRPGCVPQVASQVAAD